MDYLVGLCGKAISALLLTVAVLICLLAVLVLMVGLTLLILLKPLLWLDGIVNRFRNSEPPTSRET